MWEKKTKITSERTPSVRMSTMVRLAESSSSSSSHSGLVRALMVTMKIRMIGRKRKFRGRIRIRMIKSP